MVNELCTNLITHDMTDNKLGWIGQMSRKVEDISLEQLFCTV